METIAGSVTGNCRDCKVVLFAKGDVWYVQPWSNSPFTEVDSNGTWRNDTHLGTEYSALLVRGSYKPPERVSALPAVGDEVLAVAREFGKRPDPKEMAQSGVQNTSTIQFAGYEWEIKSSRSSVGPGPNYFGEDNVMVDSQGKLHLRIVKQGERWTCAEVINKKSLGFGTYTFVVEDTSQMSPSAVLGLFTWDNFANQQNYREIDFVEISRWGDPVNKNGQFVIQPYTRPENIVRFEIPSGPTIHSTVWEPERVRCRSMRFRPDGSDKNDLIHEHEFTSGIPAPGREQVRINLWIAGGRPTDDAATEVVISGFKFVPFQQ